MLQQKRLISVARGAIACEIGGHLSAIQAGAGVAGLPCFVGDADADFQRVTYDGDLISRDIWMVGHRDRRRSPQVRAVMEFLLKIVGESSTFATRK
ncbi:LysR substrate-binding domain-containing protein [Burkholderia multivorans]|nr:LysR substrate-binding domain-containing protein [Burkholderia multivorans]